MKEQEVLTEKEAAAYLKLGIRTLRDWRYLNKGPSFFKYGIQVRYRRASLEQFLCENEFKTYDSYKKCRDLE